MRINKRAFNDYVQKVLRGEDEKFNENKVNARFIEDIDIQFVDLVKVRGVDKYDLIVSMDNIEANTVIVRDLIDYVCMVKGINYRKIMIEL